jgi:hypothetical protein
MADGKSKDSESPASPESAALPPSVLQQVVEADLAVA